MALTMTRSHMKLTQRRRRRRSGHRAPSALLGQRCADGGAQADGGSHTGPMPRVRSEQVRACVRACVGVIIAWVAANSAPDRLRMHAHTCKHMLTRMSWCARSHTCPTQPRRAARLQWCRHQRRRHTHTHTHACTHARTHTHTRSRDVLRDCGSGSSGAGDSDAGVHSLAPSTLAGVAESIETVGVACGVPVRGR
jgi:hypothetical protein